MTKLFRIALIALSVGAFTVVTAMPNFDGSAAYAAGKKAKKKKKGKAKSRAGKCGTYKYWKKGKCLDARNKK